MKKKWLSILLISSLILAFLAGCGSDCDTQIDNENVVVVATTEGEDAIEVSSSVQESIKSDCSEGTENADVSSDQESFEFSDYESDETMEYSSVSNNFDLSD